MIPSPTRSASVGRTLSPVNPAASRLLARTLFALAIAAILANAQTPPQTPPQAAPRPRPAAAAPAAPAAPANPLRDLKFPPLRLIEAPKAAAFTLPNGMKLFLIEDREVPVVSGVARIHTGNLFDPAGKVGVATLTGMAMRTGGTRQMTGEELDRKLEDMAARVETAIGESAGEVSFFSLAENSAEVLAAFRDVLTVPAFRIDKVDLAKMQLRGSVSRRNDDPDRILAREFPALVYGPATPYGWTPKFEDIGRIARADLLAFHKRYFFPKNVTLAVWGDFETARMKERLERLFAGWTVEQPPVPEFPNAAAKPAPGVYLARKIDLPLTSFAIGHLGGKNADKDYPALTVMAGILGGGFSSRLFERVHTRMGNASNISARWAGAYGHPGTFEISGAAKSHSTVATIQAIKQELERMRTAEVSEEELRTARDGALDSLAFASGTRRQILDRMLAFEYFGYPADFLQQYQKALASVTAAVLRVAKEYLRPADLTILVVGDPDEFVPSLEGLGPVREIDMTIPEPKAIAAATDTASLEQGKLIMARMQAAVGGAEKLAAVKDYTAIREVRIAAAAGGETLTETESWIAPAYLREDADRSGLHRALYTDGKSGWTARGRQSAALLGPTLKGMQSDLFRSYFSFLLSDRVAERTVTALDENTVEISAPGGLVARVAVSPETGLPQQISYTIEMPTGPPVLVQEIYSRFEDVAGMRVPYECSALHDGEIFDESTVKDFKVNSGLVLSQLERRQ
jgi:zinc protease